MQVKNITKHVVNIDGKHILPMQVVSVDDAFRNSLVVSKMIKNNELEEVKGTAKQEELVSATTLDDFKTFLGNSPSLTKIKNFAKKNKIELADAQTEEEMIAIISACLSTAE